MPREVWDILAVPFSVRVPVRARSRRSLEVRRGMECTGWTTVGLGRWEVAMAWIWGAGRVGTSLGRGGFLGSGLWEVEREVSAGCGRSKNGVVAGMGGERVRTQNKEMGSCPHTAFLAVVLRCQSQCVDEGVIEAMPLGRGLVVEQYPHCEGNMSSREGFQKKKRNPHSCIYKTKQRNRTPKSVSQAIPGSRDSSRNPNKITADPLVPAKEWESISQYFRLRTSQLSCCPCVSTLDRQTEEPPLQRAPLCLSRPLGCVLTALTVVRLQQDKTAQVSKGTTFGQEGTRSVQRIGRSTTCLLFELQPLDDGSELAQNLIGPLVVLGLRGDELGEVAQGLGGVENLGR